MTNIDLNTTLNGLSEEAVNESKSKFGTNALTPKRVATVWEMLWDALNDICVKILLLALAVKVVISII